LDEPLEVSYLVVIEAQRRNQRMEQMGSANLVRFLQSFLAAIGEAPLQAGMSTADLVKRALRFCDVLFSSTSLFLAESHECFVLAARFSTGIFEIRDRRRSQRPEQFGFDELVNQTGLNAATSWSGGADCERVASVDRETTQLAIGCVLPTGIDRVHALVKSAMYASLNERFAAPEGRLCP
jgi:hypothetical protein